MQPKLLVELRNAAFQLVDQPAGEALGFSNGEFAELGAGAGHGAAPKIGGLHVQADLAEFADQLTDLSVRHIKDD